MSVTVVHLGIVVSVVRADLIEKCDVANHGSDQNLASAQLVSSRHGCLSVGFQLWSSNLARSSLPPQVRPGATSHAPSMDDPAPTRAPLLTQPFEAGVTGWLVVFGAIVAEIVGGIVTNRMSTTITAPVLAFPVAVALGV